jgi:small-conductance mechanosensitive channel
MFALARAMGFAATLACLAMHAFAQAPAAPPSPAPAAATAEASTLVFMNRPIVTFRAAYLGFGPVERASQSRTRIEAQLMKGGPGRVTTQPMDVGVAVNVDGGIAFAVTNGDVDAVGATKESVAQAAARELERAIEESRESRDIQGLAKSAAIAIVGTLIFVLGAWLLRRARLFIGARLEARARLHARHISVAGVEVFEGSRLIMLLQRTLSAVYWLLILALAYEWLGRMFELFPFTRPWGERINGFILDTALQMLGSIAGSVPSLVVAVVIFLIARFIVGLVRRFFDRIELRDLDLGWIDGDTARPTRRLVTIAVWLLAAVMAYPYLPGANSDAFKGMSVLVGLMVSLGGASVIGQALSGIILMYTRTFRVGEFVRVGENEGTVMEMGMYQTRIRTGLGDELYLPNALVLQSVTRNYSRDASGGFIMQATVSIGYDVPWRQVHAMLLEAARRTAAILKEPVPRVLQVELSDFYVVYRLVAHSDPSDPAARAEAHSRLHENILDAFNEHGVQIMSPHYFTDPHETKTVPKARWYESPAKPPERP